MEALLCGSRSSVASERIDNVQAAPNNPAVNIMQTIHKACLALTGVVVVILCVGIGMGIGRRLEGKISDDNSTDYDNSTEYEAYDEDYVDNDKLDTRVIDILKPVQVQISMIERMLS